MSVTTEDQDSRKRSLSPSPILAHKRLRTKDSTHHTTSGGGVQSASKAVSPLPRRARIPKSVVVGPGAVTAGYTPANMYTAATEPQLLPFEFDHAAIRSATSKPELLRAVYALLHRFSAEARDFVSSAISPLNNQPSQGAHHAVTPASFRDELVKREIAWDPETAANSDSLGWLMEPVRAHMAVLAVDALSNARELVDHAVRDIYPANPASSARYLERTLFLEKAACHFIQDALAHEDVMLTIQRERLAGLKSQFRAQFHTSRLHESCKGDTAKIDFVLEGLHQLGYTHADATDVALLDAYSKEVIILADVRAHLELLVERASDMVANAIIVRFYRSINQVA
ncbi:hypothetical protein BOTBODRAFT_181677 [Botryobasidium botryosum FD-172 SS1]|uniref:Uncharacterized protein n=1 Tax=Botryobasidium botryosum (strain FD-172 SS1) TaxID=930990 RepID=A0A067M471_BOTB1|nr:hypothetical protein BOTBODRAFT_181677 [Botryobasidium botryosum FD-172 SS1]